MNLPNKLTLFRVILIPFFVAALLIPGLPGGKWIALAFFCVASVTDFFDGRIARKYNLVTNFGKFMDPLADKLLVGSASICLTAMGLLPAWIVVILIGRELDLCSDLHDHRPDHPPGQPGVACDRADPDLGIPGTDTGFPDRLYL